MGILENLARPFMPDSEIVSKEDLAAMREIAQAGKVALVDNVRINERLSELEVSLEQEGWIRYDQSTSRELSRDGLQRMVRLARLMYLSNPLINQGVNVQFNYVWGQGVSIVATEPTIDKVVQHMLNDRSNRAEFTSSQAQQQKEVELMVTGNIFFVLFTSPRGSVKIRSIAIEEVAEIICNPEDARDPWYYRREWTRYDFDPIRGIQATNIHIDYYPDWQYKPDPSTRPDAIQGYPVHWESPIYHVKTGGMSGMRFGVPEVYPALDWARAAQQDLQAYASIHQALSRFAWQMILPNSAGAVSAAKTRFSSTASSSDPHDSNPPPATASTFIRTSDVELRPMQTRGMAPDPEEGHRLWLMTAAGLGIPETFFGDANVGNHATAATLDRPTELKFESRRRLWVDVLKDLCDYAIDQNALSEFNDLKGVEEEDDGFGDGEIIIYDKDGTELDRSVKVAFPTLLERNVNTRVDAIVSAATLAGRMPANTMTPRLLAQLLLEALNVVNVNEELDHMFGEDGGLELPPPPVVAPPTGPNMPGAPPGAPAQPSKATVPRAPSAQKEAVLAEIENLRNVLEEVIAGEDQDV